MRIVRKLIFCAFLACFVLSSVLAFGLTASDTKTARAADQADVSHYFYDQLTSAEQRQFYQAMETMHNEGIFIKGEDYDLTANDLLSQEQLEAYANGDNTILNAMGAARDAFYTDYDDIFYVDFSYLSLRVTQTSDGQYHAYLGSGRGDSYWVQGFSSEQSIRDAITEYQAARDKIVEAAKAAEPTEELSKELGELATLYSQIREAHRQIALTSVYRLESEAGNNAGHVRTPYGAFVKHMALCEGYSRAFKAIMDELGVPCVLINGGYRHTETQTEEHMWTYVQLCEDWYAVDMTFDDINLDDKGGSSPLDDMDGTARASSELGYYYTEEYFLKGATVMDAQHATSHYKSAVGYEFTYPELSLYSIGAEEATRGIIKVVQQPHGGVSPEKATSTDIYVSILIDGEWYGQKEAIEQKGYYLLMRHEGNYLPEKVSGGLTLDDGDLYDETDPTTAEYAQYVTWAYVYNPTVPELYGYVKDYKGYTVIENESKATGFEFAVTNVPPRPWDMEHKDQYTVEQISEMTTFLGNTSMLIARSEFIETKYNEPDYQPAPFIVRSSPAINGMLRVGTTYQVKIEYDQLLKLPDNEELKYSVYGMRASGEILKGTNAVIRDNVIKNVKWWGGSGTSKDDFVNSWISFDFTPSKEFAHDDIMYIFNFNLIGVNSGKQVNCVEYVAANKTSYCSLGVYGYNWNIFGQPQLLESGDLSREGWIDSNGNDVSQMKDRISLVVTSPSPQQDAKMNDLITDELKDLNLTQQEKDKDGKYGELDENSFQSFTYNIQLTCCKAMIVQTGESLRLSIGFPEGFTYESWMSGTTFKMYHFIHDKQNNIIGVEEIPVTVTPLGLIILVKSFSPFALVVVQGEAQPENADRTVVIPSSTGGTAYATVKGEKSNMFTLSEGQTRDITAKANPGYIIESINVGNKVILTNASEVSFPVSYDDIKEQNIVKVNFVSETVKVAEEARGESAVVQREEGATVQQVQKPKITVTNKSVTANVGEKIELTATVESYGESDTYQWYKNGVAVKGQTGKTLTIDSARTGDAGTYTLKVTSKSGITSVSSVSEEISVKVLGTDPVDTTPAKSGMSVETIMIIIISCIAGLGILMLIVLFCQKAKK